MTTISLEPVDSISITTLVDNATDMLAPDQGPARRADVAAAGAPRMPAAYLEGGQALDALRAEHGVSALATIERAGKPPPLPPRPRAAPPPAVDAPPRPLGRANRRVITPRDGGGPRRILTPGREPIELPSTSKP